jgi:hypothetical protein
MATTSQFQDADRLLIILHGCRTLKVTKGYTALIDEDDYPRLCQRAWTPPAPAGDATSEPLDTLGAMP